MKLTVALLLFSVFQGQARITDAQKITIVKRQVSLSEVLTAIEKQTGYLFFYDQKQVEQRKRINVSVKNATLTETLNACLAEVSLTYTVVGRTIVISSQAEPDFLVKASANRLRKRTKESFAEIGGMVSNQQGEPLQGVSVVVKETNKGVSTDAQGGYRIDAEPGQTLIFTFIGYNPISVVVGNERNVDVTMTASLATGLDEVVVVGYGTQTKKTLTGSVASIQGSDVIKTPVMNVSNSLAGQIPGVSFTTRAGEPGHDGSTIRIRGVNTLGDNSPLIVVDGVPGRSLDRIDPNSIESISVLKDASAAIYGSQAGNGVILITTKRGKRGKPQVDVSGSYGIQQPTRIPKLTDAAQYATALNELDAYAGLTPRYSQDDIQAFADGSDPWGHPNTDWYKAVLKDWSHQMMSNVSISGGSDFMQYFVSLGGKTEDSYYKNSATKYNQYDIRTNLNFNVSKDIKLNLDMVGRVEDARRPGRSGDGNMVFYTLLRSKPNMPAYYPNGKIGPDIERGENPAALVTNMTGFTKDQNYVLNTNLGLDINIPWVEGLSISGNAALDKGFLFRKNFQTPWYLYSWDGVTLDANGEPLLVAGRKGISDPNLTETFYNGYSFLLNSTINYIKTFSSGHHIGFLAGIEKRGDDTSNFNAYRRYFISTALPELNLGGTNEMNNGGSAVNQRRLNYFGRVNYDYKQRYLAEFVWRLDGSYIFPEQGRFGFFPGVSLGWRMSDENFWKNGLSSFSDNVKLRASYGLTGNDRIDAWQYLTTYGFGSGYIFDIDNESQTLVEQRIPNPNVTWEKAKQFDVGIDAGFIDNKLQITFDYFNYHRSDILWLRNASVPTSSGLTLPRENIGKTKNAGFDFNASYSSRLNDLSFTVFINGGYAKNKILFWDETPGVPDYQKFTGHPMPTSPNDPNADLYYQAIGIFKDEEDVNKQPHWQGARPGDVIFKDVNGDGVIDGNDRVRSDKTDIPTFSGALGINLQYRGFDLSVLFQGASGAQRYLRLEAAGNFGNYLLSDFTDRWTPDHTDATKPRMFDRTDQYYRSQRNTYLLHNTDYLRLKNVELGYNLPENVVKGVGIENLRVFVKGFNIATISHFKDFDPEDNNTGGSSYPLQRILSTGLSLTF